MFSTVKANLQEFIGPPGTGIIVLLSGLVGSASIALTKGHSFIEVTLNMSVWAFCSKLWYKS